MFLKRRVPPGGTDVAEMRRRTALAMVAILCALFHLPQTSATPSRVMEMSFEDFDDETKVPVYDGPGDFISLAFYSSWDLRVRTSTTIPLHMHMVASIFSP